MRDETRHYDHPARGWESAASLRGASHPHRFEFCENGDKATIWESTHDRCSPEFFDRGTGAELLGWQDFDLEIQRHSNLVCSVLWQ